MIFTWNMKYLTASEEVTELLRIHSCTGDNNLDVSPPLSNVGEYSEQHVSMQTPFVRLVHHHTTILSLNINININD